MNGRRNLFWAIPFIVVGVVWIMNNMGVIASDIFHIIVSWQMLVIYVGLGSISRRHYVGGMITMLVGVAFLMPELGWLDSDWLEVYWPAAFVIVGLMMIFEPRKRKQQFRDNGENYHTGHTVAGKTKTDFVNTDGYVESDNTFGYVEQIILDPVFRGARIRSVFGGTVLDLRKTRLETPKTYIDIDCKFAGVEIYIPADWQLTCHASPVMGGCDDKRFNASIEMDREHILVVRGNIVCGGVEFQS